MRFPAFTDLEKTMSLSEMCIRDSFIPFLVLFEIFHILRFINNYFKIENIF